MSSSSVAIIDRPELKPDKVIVSYLKRIAAASSREIRDKQAEDPRRYRLLSQFDPEIIDVILKYARGEEDDCHHRPRCRRPVHMTDALRNFKACALCRAKRALHDSKATEEGKTGKGKKRKRQSADNKDKGKARQRSPEQDSDASYVPSPSNSPPPDPDQPNESSTDRFTRAIKTRLLETYVVGAQIDIDQYLLLDTPPQVTLADSLQYTLDALKEAASRAWPYAEDIQPDRRHNAINTNVACTATFGCSCWAPGEARDEHGRYSHDCGGTINFVATHCPQLGDNVHQVHVSFVHTVVDD